MGDFRFYVDKEDRNKYNNINNNVSMSCFCAKGGDMMKKRYEELEVEVVRFDAEDVITTSGVEIACEFQCECELSCECQIK